MDSGFEGNGGVCVASCYYLKIPQMRDEVHDRGHSMCVSYFPDDELKFAVVYGVLLERYARDAQAVIVITGDQDETGNWQGKEMTVMQDLAHPIKFQKMTLERYKAHWPVMSTVKKLTLVPDMVRTLEQVIAAFESDRQWGDSTLEGLHTAGEIQTLKLKSMDVIEDENLKAFSEKLIKKFMVGDAAQTKTNKERIEDKLLESNFVEASVDKIFNISLSYEMGGFQYMSCLKFFAKKKDKSYLIFYALYGKKWTQRADKHLNKLYWESDKTRLRIKNFLEVGASEILKDMLIEPDATNALQECRTWQFYGMHIYFWILERVMSALRALVGL